MTEPKGDGYCEKEKEEFEVLTCAGKCCTNWCSNQSISPVGWLNAPLRLSIVDRIVATAKEVTFNIRYYD